MNPLNFPEFNGADLAAWGPPEMGGPCRFLSFLGGAIKKAEGIAAAAAGIGGGTSGSGGISCNLGTEGPSGACASKRGLSAEFNQLVAAFTANPTAMSTVRSMITAPNGPWNQSAIPLDTPAKVAGVAIAYATGGGSQGAEVVSGLSAKIAEILSQNQGAATFQGTTAQAVKTVSSGLQNPVILLGLGGAVLYLIAKR